jgi:hypothetical protein
MDPHFPNTQGDTFEPTQPKQPIKTVFRRVDPAQRRLMMAVQLEMLKTIGDFMRTPYPPIWHKIIAARDIDALWDLRVELMGELSKAQGELVAKQLLTGISQSFSLKP